MAGRVSRVRDAMRDLVGDSKYIDNATQQTFEDADALIEFCKVWKAAMPDVTGTVTNVVESGDQVVLEISWQGTHTGDFVTEQGTIPASGKQQTTPAAWIFEYDEDGNPKESRQYFNLLTFLQQIGAA